MRHRRIFDIWVACAIFVSLADIATQTHANQSSTPLGKQVPSLMGKTQQSDKAAFQVQQLLSPSVKNVPPQPLVRPEQLDAKTHEEPPKYSEWLVAVFTGLLAIITGWLVYYTRKLWGSTKELVERSDVTSRTHERAYLFGDLQPTWHPHAVMICKNDGRTLAFIKSVQWGICAEAEFPEKLQVSEIIDGNSPAGTCVNRISCDELIRANGQISLWQVQIECLGNVGRIFFGRVCYEDVFKTSHYTTFKFRLAILQPGSTKGEPLEGCYADWT